MDVLPVPLSGFAVGLVDWLGDLLDDFGDALADFFGDAVADVFGEAVEVPPGAAQLTPLDDGVEDALAEGVLVGRVVADDVGVPVGTPVLGLTGGLDAAFDEVAGLDDVAGVEVTGGLLVFGVVSWDGAGELVAPRQDALGEATWLDGIPAAAAV